jgi:hypothetical protein
MGGILHRRPLGPAGSRKDAPAQRSRNDCAYSDGGAHGRRRRGANCLGPQGSRKSLSWGSYLGVEIAQRHPEWLHAYIAVGQLADGPESERRGWRFALEAARRTGKVSESPVGLELHIAGGTKIFIYAKANHTPASFTILNFPVADLEQAVDRLTQRGVCFEHYDQNHLKTDNKGIARGVALT